MISSGCCETCRRIFNPRFTTYRTRNLHCCSSISGLWVGIAANVQEPQPHPHRGGTDPVGFRIARAFRNWQPSHVHAVMMVYPLFGYRTTPVLTSVEARPRPSWLWIIVDILAPTTASPVMTVLLRKASEQGIMRCTVYPINPLCSCPPV